MFSARENTVRGIRYARRLENDDPRVFIVAILDRLRNTRPRRMPPRIGIFFLSGRLVAGKITRSSVTFLNNLGATRRDCDAAERSAPSIFSSPPLALAPSFSRNRRSDPKPRPAAPLKRAFSFSPIPRRASRRSILFRGRAKSRGEEAARENGSHTHYVGLTRVTQP